MKVITSTQTLMKLAGELGQARLSKDPERIKAAQQAHDEYVEICLKADEMHTGMTLGQLYGK